MQLKGLTALSQQLPTGHEGRQGDPGRSLTWMNGISTKPEPRHGGAACQAKGSETTGGLPQSADDAVWPTGPAEKTPRCRELLMTPGVIGQAQGSFHFVADFGLTGLLFALVVGL